MAIALLLSGRVQGVACRYYCSHTAHKMMIGGSATNMPDGRVRVVLETDDDGVVQRYAEALKNNRFGILFFGRITEIQIQNYTGPTAGDYNF